MYEEFLKENLGCPLAQYIINSQDQAKIDVAYKAIVYLQKLGESNTIIQAWFQGMNPYIDDRSPAMLIVDWTGNADILLKYIYGAAQVLL